MIGLCVGRLLQVLCFFGSTKAEGGESMTNEAMIFETIKLMLALISLLIVVFNLGKESHK